MSGKEEFTVRMWFEVSSAQCVHFFLPW